MVSPDMNGTDGSSIKPVSSLRAKFENMHTNTSSELGSGPTPPRTLSPSPKPDQSRDVRASEEASNGTRPPPPRPRSDRLFTPATHLPLPQQELAPRSPARAVGPPPPLSPRPIRPPPSVMVQPPLSPPKAVGTRPSQIESTTFLNPDSVASTPTTPVVPPRPLRSPSPSTTVREPRSVPKPNPVKAPSPPPPRRSAELRREREYRQPPPPPVSRGAKPKPLIPAQSNIPPQVDRARETEPRKLIKEETSPFSSPPTSPGSTNGETPPLPARPKPHVVQPELSRPKASDLGFKPPPIHHSLALKKHRENEAADSTRDRITVSQLTGEQPPALPSRPQTVPEPAVVQETQSYAMKPPPRPPRLAATSVLTRELPPAPKRIVSTPTSQILPPPGQIPGRSNTVVDRPSDRSDKGAAHDVRPLPHHAVPTCTTPIASQPPGAKPEVTVSGYPDPSNTNRRPPYVKQGAHELATKYDTRLFDVCGDLVCTTGLLTRVWNVRDGEMLMSFSHGEGIRATAVAFKPGPNVDEEGKRLWIGNNMGEIMEADIATQSVVAKKGNAHARHEVVKIYRHYNELWTLDESGTIAVWGPDEEHTPNLDRNPHQTYRVPRNHTFSMVIGSELWHATGKEIRVFAPTMAGETQFQVLVRPLTQDNAGDVSSGTLLRSQPGKAFFGHSDGKISVYNTKEYSCVAVHNVTSFKINTLAGVGSYLWAGFNNGRVCVYDIEPTPWLIKKEWQAHENPVVKIAMDPSSFYRLNRLQVVSLGADNMLRLWDGLLQDDWYEAHMKAHETSFCRFEDLNVMAMTWNAGASTPHSLRYAEEDAVFIRNLLQSSGSPDILVFGFQELVDLEDKTATAKRFLKSKKKEGPDQERMSHQYRDWRDFLLKSLDDYMPAEHLYHLLHTSTLVGLFTCIFVKASIRDRIRNLSSSEVKRGMGGLHGNKGAIVVRFMVDNTSMCFINCHLAAGQSQANSRHNDIAAILDTQLFPVERDPDTRIDSYMGGGDGSMILDHELCLLNGDLNYRIDTMSRDTVVIAVKQNNLAKLLERDQLLVARRRNPGFRLRAFDEMPITFAPTYKYDVGADTYDTSEKRRSPAWCDRLLYRGGGRIKQLDYRRHEVRVSDHRPVTGRFKFTVKWVDPKARAKTWMDCQIKLEEVREKEGLEEKYGSQPLFVPPLFDCRRIPSC
ncbi:DNase I-like protein [Sodiomyces alkalinus F11]|uniref:DNase I-like protein n=1 Tax=Sodiomyces alkalinus (strain CBS 110278 / VKM F-3762 / F11) TaxID=1314773 RepID=A0A3N2Q985_SODAK|nr:DNase I-like protein [Sodiomyces alkalinus F11]ROT43208.1 DNase I-like protein [Sodiomyces alkalinus F11]